MLLSVYFLKKVLNLHLVSFLSVENWSITLREGRSSRISVDGTYTCVQLREIFIYRSLVILTVSTILFRAIQRSVRKGEGGT
jgi:hypothetical protein